MSTDSTWPEGAVAALPGVTVVREDDGGLSARSDLGRVRLQRRVTSRTTSWAVWLVDVDQGPVLVPVRESELMDVVREHLTGWLTARRAAGRVGVHTKTWASWASRGRVPVPDDPGDLSVPPTGRQDLWRVETVLAWDAERTTAHAPRRWRWIGGAR